MSVRDPLHASDSGAPTLVATPSGAVPERRKVDPTAATLTPSRGDVARPPRAEESPAPAAIGRFTVLRELGRGGTGVVYAAYDEQLDRKVAVKLLHSETREDIARVRLMREAQAMARLSHPNIVGVHEVGTFGRQVYVAMEFVHGMTLHAWLKRRRRPFHEIAAMFRQAGEGLAAAHDAGLVHRDFKPANVMVGEDGRVRVLDFGLARADVTPSSGPGLEDLEPAEEHASSLANLRSLDASITLTGLMLGTPAYMAPEQFLGSRVDARSDQFAFCVALYEAAYRGRPFPGDTLAELMANVLAGVVTDVPAAPGLPRGLRPLLLQGLRREPAERWPAMRPLLTALAPMARAPVRRSWFAGVGLLAALTGGATLMATQGGLGDPVCSGGEAQIAAVWNEDVRVRLTAGAAASTVPGAPALWTHADAGLEAYSQDWRTGYADACDATAELLDLRMACLGERRHAFATAIGMFEQLDADLLARAGQVVAGLPAIASCADEAYLRAKVPPPDPQLKQQVKDLRDQLSSALTFETGGKLDDALTVVDQAIAQAPASYPPLRAELAYTRGSILENLGRYEEARDALDAAFFFALKASYLPYVVDAANRLAYIVGRRLDDPVTGQDWLEHADVYAEQDTDPLRRARVATTRGALANFARTMEPTEKVIREQARRAFHEAGRAFAEAGVDDTVDYARFLRFHGDFLSTDHDLEAGIRAEAEALRLMRGHLGAQHPDVAMVHNSHGLALMRADRHADALATFRAGLDAAVDLPRQRNHVYETLWYNSSDALEKLGRIPEADEAMVQAIGVLERSSARPLKETVFLHLRRAHLLNEQGRPDLAEALLREQLAFTETTWGPHDSLLMEILLQLGVERRQSNDPQESRVLLERALALSLAGEPAMRTYQHPIRWQLARTLAALGDNAGALTLARQVRAHNADQHSAEIAMRVAEMDRFIAQQMAARGGT